MSNMNILTGKEKAHFTNEMDFSQLIAGYAPATAEQLTYSGKHNLAYLLQAGKLKFIPDDIQINGKALTVNSEFIYTANSLATLLYDERQQPSGIAFFPLDKFKSPECYYTDPDKLQAFILSNGGDGEIIAVERLEHTTGLHELMGNYTAFIPYDRTHFESMALNLASQNHITVIADSSKENRYSKVFKEHDITLVCLTAPLEQMAVNYGTWDNLLTDGLEAGEVTVTNFQAQSLDHAKAKITQLASYDELTYQLKKRGVAKELGIGVTDLDRIVKQERQGLEVDKIVSIIADVKPYPQAVNGNELALEIFHLVKNHIVCTDPVAIAVTVWIFFTWCIDVCHVAPIAWINAPEKRCGKTQLATLIGRMSNRTISTTNITPAALFRCIERHKPTLIIDEADSFFNSSEDLRGIINAGFSRDNCYLWRCVGELNEPAPFDVFGAKVISGIGKLPATVMDRSISITLRRALPHEKKQRVKDLPKEVTDTIKSKLMRWRDDNIEKVASSKPSLPDSIYNREYDTWEILFQIADVLGDKWLPAVTQSCLYMNDCEPKEPSINEELLTDIKAVFERQGVTAIPTKDLLTALVTMDKDGITMAWATINKGQPMTDRQLASRLKDFGVRPKPIKRENKVFKGYTLADFTDVFNRYLA